MYQLLSTPQDRQTSPTLPGNETDFRADDRFPSDHPAEQYPAWRATAIYNLAPFYSPPR